MAKILVGSIRRDPCLIRNPRNGISVYLSLSLSAPTLMLKLTQASSKQSNLLAADVWSELLLPRSSMKQPISKQRPVSAKILFVHFKNTVVHSSYRMGT